MPYLITTGPGGRFGMPADRLHPGDELVAPPYAVATLDEAREAALRDAQARRSFDAPGYGVAFECRHLGVNGGKVGPLPDGTVIEVQPITWSGLEHAAGLPYPSSATPGGIVAAFNEAQA